MSEAVSVQYAIGQDDESLAPLVLTSSDDQPVGRCSAQDSVIFYDIRGEREIQLTDTLTNNGFTHFPIKKNLQLNFKTMIEYDPDLRVSVAFPPVASIEDTLCHVLSKQGLTQAKIVETEKSVHMSFFLNGKRNDPLEGENRFFVPSLHNVSNYDEYPEMQVQAVTEKVIDILEGKRHEVVFCNFANVDVIGHIENEKAVISAVEAVDRCLGTVVDAALQQGYRIIITADHGTVEKWRYPDGLIDTGHTDSLVPFIYLQKNEGQDESPVTIRDGGALTDIGPSVLDLLHIPKPDLMTGESLFMSRDATSPQEKRPHVLIMILDGWGIAPASDDNLISRASTPVMDRILERYPHSTLRASGTIVGMPEGSVGNSEAGHLHIGAGRTIHSDRLRIDRSLEDGSFFENEQFLNAVHHSIEHKTTLHLLGIVSFFSSHGSLNHLFALMDLAKNQGVKSMMIHALLGRRGEHKDSGARYIRKVEDKCVELELGRVATVMGRFWALDREYNWDRVEKAYRALVYGDGTPVICRNS